MSHFIGDDCEGGHKTVLKSELIANGQCPHEDLRETPYFRESFCFDCEDFIDVVTGEIAPDAKVRVPLDDEIDAVKGEPFTHQRWADLMADALLMAMARPNRPTTRAIFRLWRARMEAKKRAGAEAWSR